MLRQLLSQSKADSKDLPRIAVVGVGNLLRSDDAAGLLIVRLLSMRACAAEKHVLILEAGQAPENRTAELRRFLPDLVLILDAADMGKVPGTVDWISDEAIDGMSASTHSMPLSMLTHYLKLELNCHVAILGIQITSNDVGENVSPSVLRAIHEVADELEESIHICFSR